MWASICPRAWGDDVLPRLCPEPQGMAGSRASDSHAADGAQRPITITARSSSPDAACRSAQGRAQSTGTNSATESWAVMRSDGRDRDYARTEGLRSNRICASINGVTVTVIQNRNHPLLCSIARTALASPSPARIAIPHQMPTV
jgi:hypothetical protein